MNLFHSLNCIYCKRKICPLRFFLKRSKIAKHSLSCWFIKPKQGPTYAKGEAKCPTT